MNTPGRVEFTSGMPAAIRPARRGKHGISDATFYKRRSRYGVMEETDARRLKALEDENRRLKKLPVELMLGCIDAQGDARKNF